jgi:2-dehydropantoate 2-reductase
MHINSSVVLIGSGRLAKHLLYWNSLLENPNEVFQWSRTQSLEQLKSHLEKSNIVWLAISDNALLDFYETHLKSAGKRVVHFSGAFNNSNMLCAHPLMSFPNELLPTDIYPHIHFALSNFENLEQALPSFKNTFKVLSPQDKALYHALCVLAGNFPQMLWSEVSEKMQQLEIPEASFDLYIKQITENYLNYKNKAITGPIIRKDEKTILANLESLKNEIRLKSIYSNFNKEFNI